MLKRFMTWLLHRLQKVLSIFSGRRGRARPSMPAQQKPDRSPPVRPTEPLSLNNFALPSSADLAATGSELEAPHQLDPAPAIQEMLLVSQHMSVETAEVALPLTAVDYSLVEIQDASQLPEIHDLLPATEPDDPVDLPVEAEPPQNKIELPLERNEPAAADLPELGKLPDPKKHPEQAILFSFDIIESEMPADEAIAQPSPATTVSTPAAPRDEMAYQTAKLRERPFTLSSTLSVADSPPVLAAPPTELPLPTELSSPTDRMELDQPAASPADNEAKAPAQISIVIEETPEEIFEETVTAADLAPAIEAPAEPSPTAEQPVKKGVVKLLFTAKPGNFHGYIAPDDGSKDILFHQKYLTADIFERLERGTPVTATVKYVEGKAYATSVDL